MTNISSDGGADAQFRRYLAEGRFMIQRGAISGNAVFFPRAVSPVTGEDLLWCEASGRGVVHSTTIVRKRPPELSYNVALIDLAEGPRMMSRVEGIDPADVRIGLAVRARIVPGEDGPMIIFTPHSDAS